MSDFEQAYSHSAPLVSEPDTEGTANPVVHEPRVVIQENVDSQTTPKKSSIEEDPDTDGKDDKEPLQSTKPPALPIQTNPYFYPTNPYTYTPINKAPTGSTFTTPSDSTWESSIPPPQTTGLTGIRVLLATVAIILLCFFSAGATFVGMHSYYNARTTDSCSTQLGFDNATNYSGDFEFYKESQSRTSSNVLMNEVDTDNEEQGIRACEVVPQKPIFPNMDFALMGYHILKGFPLMGGVDNGFTKPIFQKGSAAQRLSSDGEHMVPDGIHISQDIACVTAFSSHVIQRPKELMVYMNEIVKVSSSGWGSAFSANTKYNKLLQNLQYGSEFLIISALTCKAYTVQLDLLGGLAIDKTILGKISGLTETDDGSKSVEFVTDYGTHYMKRVTYGAKYLYIYRVKQSEYLTLVQEMSILDVANYASMARLFGDPPSDNTWTEKVSKFNSKVNFQAITIGIPPAKTNAADWFDLVKRQPMPISYELGPLEDLLINAHDLNIFLNMAMARVNLNMIKVKYQKEIYTAAIQHSCMVHNAVVNLPEHACLRGYGVEVPSHSYLDCMNLCLNRPDCLAASSVVGNNQCQIFPYSEDNAQHLVAQYTAVQCQAILLPYRLKPSRAMGLPQSVDWLVVSGLIIENKKVTSRPQFSRTGCEESCLTTDKSCVVASYYSGTVCGLLTSQDTMAASINVTGEISSSVSFLKLC